MNTHTVERMIIDTLRHKAKRPGGGLTVTELVASTGMTHPNLICAALTFMQNGKVVESFTVDGLRARRLYYLTRDHR